MRKNLKNFFEKIAELWGDNLTQQNVSYACRKLNLTRKKKRMATLERDEEERAEFLKKLAEIPKEKRVYLDEAGFDNREDYPYGYSPKGERCYALKSGKKRERISWIGALKEGKLFAPLTFEGSCNTSLFQTWLATNLIPQLEPGDVIIQG